MTRFDAADPDGRRKLFVDAIAAHRERASPFLTIEVDDAHLAENGDPDDGAPVDDRGDGGSDGAPGDGAGTEPTRVLDPDLGVPWIQFADGTVNLDCTDDELDRLKALLGEFPAFEIDELTRPDDAEGTNVRVSANADASRIAQFLDAAFRRVYGLPEAYRAWVVEV